MADAEKKTIRVLVTGDHTHIPPENWRFSPAEMLKALQENPELMAEALAGVVQGDPIKETPAPIIAEADLAILGKRDLKPVDQTPWWIKKQGKRGKRF